MIDAKDLCLGNYISLEGRAFTVHSIREEQIDVHFKQQVYNYGPHAYEPIPLTEEWLLKLGFIPNQDSDWERDYKWDEFFLDTPKGRVEISDFNGEGFLIQQLKEMTRDDILITSVHQLQNIIFFTIGIELTTNDR